MKRLLRSSQKNTQGATSISQEIYSRYVAPEKLKKLVQNPCKCIEYQTQNAATEKFSVTAKPLRTSTGLLLALTKATCSNY